MFHDASGNPAMVLLKLGQREHMEQFRKGQLYMNTLKYFRDLESDPARADHYEGATHIFQPKDVIITLSAPGFGDILIDSTDLAAATTLSMNSELCCNIFCLHAITAPVNGTLFPSEHEWFGDSMVLVLKTEEFLNRVVAGAKARNLSGRSNGSNTSMIRRIPANWTDSGSPSASLISGNIESRLTAQERTRWF
jgi:hypothetical protein